MTLVSQLLTVSEIFLSIQGEGSRAGRLCGFVRLVGCNLRCNWCDTPYAWQGGRDMPIEEVLTRIAELDVGLVEVTGGEPLAQPAVLELLRRLCQEGYETLLETNGSLDISPVDPRVVRIVDFKCPSSGEDSRNLWTNIEHLTARDEVKFVLADRADYEYACRAVGEHERIRMCPVFFSPVADRLDPKVLARWILADKLNVRLGLQLHTILFPEQSRGV